MSAPPFCTRVFFRGANGAVCMGQMVHSKANRRDGTPLGRQHTFDLDTQRLETRLPPQWALMPSPDSPLWNPNPRITAPMGVEVVAVNGTGHMWLEANNSKSIPFPGLLGRFERFQGAIAWMRIEAAAPYWTDVPGELLAGETALDIRDRETEGWVERNAEKIHLAVINNGDLYQRFFRQLVMGHYITSQQGRFRCRMENWINRRACSEDNIHRAALLKDWCAGVINKFATKNPDIYDGDEEFIDVRRAVRLAAALTLNHYAIDGKIGATP